MDRRKRWWENPLDIDEQSLEYELWRQPKLVKRWHVNAANARKDVNEAKAALDLAEADLKLKITRNPGKFGLESKTIPIVEAAVIVHPKYQRAVQRHIDAKHALDTAQAMVEALEHKKQSIGKDSDFYLAGFFAEPRSRGSSELAKREVRRRVSKGIR